MLDIWKKPPLNSKHKMQFYYVSHFNSLYPTQQLKTQPSVKTRSFHLKGKRLKPLPTKLGQIVWRAKLVLDFLSKKYIPEPRY